MRRANIELHIEELVLHGFAPGDRHCIGDAVERELASLFAEQGMPPSLMQGGGMARLEAGGIDVAPGPGAEVMGARVAQALYGGLGLFEAD